MKQQLYRYVGPGTGQGEIHSVIFNEDDDIVTISGRHSWRGNLNQFQKEFICA